MIFLYISLTFAPGLLFHHGPVIVGSEFLIKQQSSSLCALCPPMGNSLRCVQFFAGLPDLFGVFVSRPWQGAFSVRPFFQFRTPKPSFLVGPPSPLPFHPTFPQINPLHCSLLSFLAWQPLAGDRHPCCFSFLGPGSRLQGQVYVRRASL